MKKHLLLSLPLCLLLSGALAQALRKSEWIYAGAGGRLVYKALERGDRIPDFSHAGYMGGGVRIPSPPATITLEPVEGDNTAAIQQAIDKISAMPPVNGFRGVVLLQPGAYPCAGTLYIHAGGVVLRGSGAGGNGTIIQMTRQPHACVAVSGTVTANITSPPALIADRYVPAGASSFNVTAVSALKAGDTIRITRPVTEQWTRFMGMDRLTRDGRPQTWLTGDITTERVITAINGHQLTLDRPLMDSYDAAYLQPPGVSVARISTSGEIAQVGIEQLRIVSPEQSGAISERHHRAFTMQGVADAWARDLEIYNTVNSISISDARRITVERVRITHATPTQGAAKPADLNGSGTQLLFNRCSIQGDNLFFFATGAKVSGPVVLLHCNFTGKGWIQPHQRWATGVLVDNCTVPGGGIDFMNRGAMGSGHGWSVGWAVAWNCQAASYLNQQPPGAANWVIGCRGEQQKRAVPFDTLPFLPEGIYDAHGAPVTPASLYLAQLAERLGPQAVRNAGY